MHFFSSNVKNFALDIFFSKHSSVSSKFFILSIFLLYLRFRPFASKAMSPNFSAFSIRYSKLLVRVAQFSLDLF